MRDDEFIEGLVEEYIQPRITELALIQQIHRRLKTDEEKSFFIQSSIPIIYSIWEGFIKKILKELLQYLDTKEIMSRDISKELLVWSLSEKIKNLTDSKDFQKKIKHSQLLLTHLENEVKFSKIRIDTKSNLNDKILRELCSNFGFFEIDDYFSEDDFYKLHRLVDTRNRISHGEYKSVGIEINKVQEYIELVTKLMHNWIDLISNFLENKKYLKDK